MAFKMGFDSTAMEAPAAVPPGIYTLRLKGFKPKWNKEKTGVLYNPELHVINHPEYDGTRVFENLPSNAGFIIYDFTHAFGLELEDMGNGQYTFPGEWDGDQNDPSTWKYTGPLTGRDISVELGSDTYEGKERTKIRRYHCALQDSPFHEEKKHTEDFLKKK